MMTSTAAIQVNLDAGPQEGWAERGPPGARLGADDDRDCRQLRCWAAGFRLAIRSSGCGARWAPRCGPFLVPVATTPASTGLKYALKAPVMMVRRTSRHRAVTDYVPFTDWVDAVGCCCATVADLVTT